MAPRAVLPDPQARAAPVVALMAVLCVVLLAWSWPARQAIEAELRPQYERKATVLALSVGRLVATATGHGIALDDLRGVDGHLAELRRQHRELAYVAVLDASGQVRFSSGTAEAAGGPRVAWPTAAATPSSDVGAVEVHVSAAHLRRTLNESLLDLLVLLVVCAVIARELLAYAAAAGPTAGAAAVATGAGDPAPLLARLRVPLLLFMLAEELTRALVPGRAHELARAGLPGWPADLLAGAPIVAFMAVVALGQPVLAPWSERFGRRRALGLGIAVGATGLAGAALAEGLTGFLLWRALAGLGWGLVFVAAQGTVVACTQPAQRTRAFAGFVGAILVAGVCGPPLGGLVADHLGLQWGFLLAAAVAGSALLALALLPGDSAAPAPPPLPALHPAPPLASTLGFGALGRLLRDPGFRTLTFAAALPAKLILAAFCFYLVPLVLAGHGATAATTGRAQMLYALALLAVMPLATRAAEAGTSQARLVGVGQAASATGGLMLAALAALGWPPGGSVAAVMLAMVLLGGGQGLSIAAQTSLLTLWCVDETRRHGTGALLGFYRLFERLGHVAGPLVAGGLVLWAGPGGAFGAIGALVCGCAAVFLWRARRREQAG